MSAKHASPENRERKAAVIVLAVGAVAAVACALGPVWVVRAGVLVALTGAVVALLYAFREMKSMRSAHLAELKATRATAANASRAHHAESMKLIADFTNRVREHGEQVDSLRAELASTQNELSTVRGNLVSARADVSAKASEIEALNATVAELEQQVAALVAQLAKADEPTGAQDQDTDQAAEQHGEQGDAVVASAEVVTIPSRAISRKALAKLPTAQELWAEGDHPTNFTLEGFDLEVLEGEGHSALELRKQA